MTEQSRRVGQALAHLHTASGPAFYHFLVLKVGLLKPSYRNLSAAE